MGDYPPCVDKVAFSFYLTLITASSRRHGKSIRFLTGCKQRYTAGRSNEFSNSTEIHIRARYSHQPMPETSIVVRSFNEAEYIEDVLVAVSEQEYQDFEIILVDSGSTDGTLDIAEQYVDKIEFVAPYDFTFGHSCNVGCEAADGQFVSFLSAHAIPTDEKWLGPMVENLRDDEVAMTYSNQVGAEENKFPERRLFDELFQEERKRQTPPDYFANNASSVIKRDLWEHHQFDEYLTGHEDIEWAKHFMDQGYVVVYEPDSCIYHIHDETWGQVYNRFEREAIADVEIGVKKQSDRWREYAEIPVDIIGDAVAALRQGELDGTTFSEIVRFRYNQHVGTAVGLKSHRDLDSDRFEYFYGGANERVVLDENGSTTIERTPLPEIKPNDVLIRTDFIGVSPEDGRVDRIGGDQFPVVPGKDYVGTVIDTGANAESVAVGDTVVGDMEFDCGICSVCSDGGDGNCTDPILLGKDTEYGAYSRFLAVPSNHVYPLEAAPEGGAIANTLARSLDAVDRAKTIVPDNAHCIVVGANSTTRLLTQILRHEEYEVDSLDPSAIPEEQSADVAEAQLVVDTSGKRETVRDVMSQTDSNAVLVLLATDYGDLTISYDEFAGKTVIDVDTETRADMERALDLLPELNMDRIIDGTYSLEEYESAWKAAREQKQLPVISVHDDRPPGSTRRDKAQ